MRHPVGRCASPARTRPAPWSANLDRPARACSPCSAPCACPDLRDPGGAVETQQRPGLGLLPTIRGQLSGIGISWRGACAGPARRRRRAGPSPAAHRRRRSPSPRAGTCPGRSRDDRDPSGCGDRPSALRPGRRRRDRARLADRAERPAAPHVVEEGLCRAVLPRLAQAAADAVGRADARPDAGEPDSVYGDGLRVVLAAVKAHGIRRVLYSSSGRAASAVMRAVRSDRPR